MKLCGTKKMVALACVGGLALAVGCADGVPGGSAAVAPGVKPAGAAGRVASASEAGATTGGPVVVRHGDLTVDGRQVSLVVTFDRPVFVTGTPMVPVSIDAADAAAALAYASGSGTKDLLFRATVPTELAPDAVSFPAGRGQVIVLPGTGDAAGDAQIRDRSGIGPTFVRGVHPEPAGPGADVLIEDGGRVVVLGAHYQRITTLTPSQIQSILGTEAISFPGLDAEQMRRDGYLLPVFVVQPGRAVDAWKVTYRSSIPCQNGRATTATGIVAIPARMPGEPAAPEPVIRPVVSYQHGTLWRKYEAPSYALQGDGEFAGGAARPAGYDDLHYGDPREARLAVAQFGGQGYVVIAADYFGMGDSPEAEGYLVKTSHQQACVDLLDAAKPLLAAEHVEPSGDLFLSGWSQGAMVTMAFLEKLEQMGVAVRAASTASTPSHMLATTASIMLNPRDGTDPFDPARTGIWINTIISMAAFAFEHSYREPGFAATVIRPEFFEAARRFATRDHVGFEFARETTADQQAGDILVRPAAGAAPLRLPMDLRTLMHPEYFDPTAVTGTGPVYYPLSRFAALFTEQNSYEWPYRSPLQMNYGGLDEAFSKRAALLPLAHQQAVNPRANPSTAVNPAGPTVTANEVVGGSHRGTYLVALGRQRFWFNALLGRVDDNPPPSLRTEGGDPSRPGQSPDILDPPLPGVGR